MRYHVPITVLLALVVAGAFFGPVDVLYATSGSMEPAIEPGDVYFVYEDARVDTGDVVTFHSHQDESIVTHRVIGEKTEGYVTKGDANPSSDQEAGHPIVARSDVIGTVVSVNGQVVTIGGLARIAAWIGANRPLLLWVGLGLGFLLWLRDLMHGSRSRVPDRPVVRIGDLMVPLLFGSFVTALLLVFWGSSTHALNYVVAGGTATATHTIPLHEAVTRTITVDIRSMPLTTTIVKTHGVTVLERTNTVEGFELFIQVPAQFSLGLYQASVRTVTFPATLPKGVIESLYDVHWLAAAIGTVTPLYAPVVAYYVGFMDGRMPLRLRSNRWLRQLGGF